MDAPTFRQDFPEFSNTTTYPDTLINFWLNLAIARLNKNVWGQIYTQGLELLTAHYVSIAAQRRKVANVGGQPGGSTGPVSSKSVDKVSIAYDAALAGYEDAGQYNLTTYGTMFYDLVQVVGAGGVQITGYVGPIPGFWTGSLDNACNDPFWSKQ